MFRSTEMRSRNRSNIGALPICLLCATVGMIVFGTGCFKERVKTRGIDLETGAIFLLQNLHTTCLNAVWSPDTRNQKDFIDYVEKDISHYGLLRVRCDELYMDISLEKKCEIGISTVMSLPLCSQPPSKRIKVNV